MMELFSTLLHIIRRSFFLLRISALIKKNMFKQAELICQRYRKKYPLDIIYRQYLAKIYEKQGIFKKAIREYEFIIEKNKGSIADYFDLIPLLFKSANYNEVISLCEELLRRPKNKVEEIAFNPFLDDTYWYLGMSNYHLHDCNKSKYFLNKIESPQFKRQHDVEKYLYKLGDTKPNRETQ